VTLVLKVSRQIPKKISVRIRLPIALMAAAAAALGAAPAALADTSTSLNWSGYSVHRSGVRFSAVHADWVQPHVSCTAPDRTYSAMWVGIGGYAVNSNALEQIGTENDCSRSGSSVSSAWYELVPAPSVSIHMTVHQGDAMAASVSLGQNNRVTLTLKDLTTHQQFRKTLRAAVIDATSADWIVEAPSACITAGACQTLPLADFGSAAFGVAWAKDSHGNVGSISDHSLWGATQITLAPSARRFIDYNAGASPGGGAVAGALATNGAAFGVTYEQLVPVTQVQTNPFFAARRAADTTTYIRH
jgi:hypothetical protein